MNLPGYYCPAKPTLVVNIACYLEGWSQELSVPEGLLPLPTGSSRLENVPLSVACNQNEQDRRSAGRRAGADDFRRPLRCRRNI